MLGIMFLLDHVLKQLSIQSLFSWLLVTTIANIGNRNQCD